MTVYGNNSEQYLRVGLFCIGIGFGLIAKDLLRLSIKNPVLMGTADLTAFLLLSAGALTASFYLNRFGIVDYQLLVGWSYPAVCCLLSGVLFLLLIVNDNGIISRILSIPVFQAIGEASLTIYLVQTFLIRAVNIKSPVRKWIIVCIASAGIGYMSYNLLEKQIYKFLNERIKKLEKG